MITVLLATHNGADTIGRTLEAMSQLEVPAEGWEIIVVNNASSDDTEALVLQWRERLPLTYLVEPRLGKSRAINAGLEHARGDLIVMTDDDVLPDRNWLCEWRRVANAWPSLDVFGGAIVPEFGDHPPRWSLPRKSLTLLYGLTPSRPEGEIAPTDVAGANLVIRRQLREEGLRFDENFLVGDKGLMGEDTAFVRRAFGKGHRVGFAPGARVRHIIHQEQVSWLWIHRRMFRHGGAVYWAEAQDALSTGGDWSILPRWRIRRAVTLFLRTAAAALCLNRDRMFEHSRNLAHDLGAIRQAIALRRQLPLARKSG